MIRNPLIWKWISAAVLGFAAGFYFYFTFINSLILTRFQGLFCLIYLVGFFTLLVYGFLWTALARLAGAGYSSRSQITWLVCSILAGLLLYLILPVSTPNFLVEPQTLEIIATGEQNPKSKGAEVWLHALQLPDGTLLKPQDFKRLGDWRQENGSLAAIGGFPARLRWQGEKTGVYKLVFGMHQWSGKVAIIWNGDEQVYDLYADPGSIQQISLLTPTNAPVPYKVIYGLSACLSFGILLFLLSAFFTTYSLKHPVQPRSVAWWWWLVYTLPIIIVELLYLLSFWPGIMSSDSYDQWNQMTRFSLNDHHPAFHTLFMWLVTRLWLSPAMVALVQILIFSLLAAWALILFQRRGVPAWLNLAALSLILVIPVPHFLNNTLWKDTTYALAFLWLVILVYQVVSSAGRWAGKWGHIFLLGLAAALMGLFRHNGWPVSFATLLALALFYPKNRWRIGCALGIAAGLVFGVKQVEYTLLNVAPTSSMLTYSAPVHLIGAHVSARTPLSPQEDELLNQIRSTGDGWTYNCFTVDSIVFSDKFNPGELSKIGGWIWKEALALSWRAPLVSLNHILCSSSMAWRVAELPGARTGTAALWFSGDAVHYLFVDEENHNPILRENSQLPWLQEVLANSIQNPNNSPILKIIWRPALYGLLAIFGLVLLALRHRDGRWLLLGLPVLFQAGVYIFFPIAQNFRYLYPLPLFFLVFWPLLYAPKYYPNQKNDSINIR